MNKASSYIASLLPSFKSSKVTDNLTNLNNELSSQTMPAIDSLLGAFPVKYVWKNKDVKVLNDTILRVYRGKLKLRNPTAIEITKAVLVNMQTTIPFAIKQTEELFGSDIASAGLTFDRATVVRYSEAAEFVINYARKLFNFISATELASLMGTRVTSDNVGPDDREFLMAMIPTFGVALTIMSLTVTELKTGYDEIPKSVIDPDSEEDMQVIVGRGKMDPFGFSALPFPLSAILHFRLAIADFQMDRYEQAVADAKVIEYRSILIKQMLASGQGDAAIERELADEEADLKIINRKIAMMEEKYGLSRTRT